MNGGRKLSITCFLKQLPKITFFLIMIMAACSQPRMGRKGWGPPRGEISSLPRYTSEELITVMNDRLDLTDDQQENVRPVIEEYCKKRQNIIGKYKGQERHGGDCCLRCDLQRLGESTEKELATILTEKQIREYQKIQDELQPRQQENGQQGTGREGPGSRGRMGRGREGWGRDRGDTISPGMLLNQKLHT